MSVALSFELSIISSLCQRTPIPPNYLLALLGAAVGGVVGYFLFFWIARQGLYAMVVPGALMGLGCGALSGTKSNAIGIVCALAAVMLGLFIEWRFAPFVNDRSFGYFLAHMHQLRSMTLIMIAVGGGVWLLVRPWARRGRRLQTGHARS